MEIYLTAYGPGSKEAGSITYTLSSDLDVKKMHIIQKGEISNARVSVLVDGENGKKSLGTLKKSLNEFYMPEGNVYELKIEWDENKIPTISEVIMLNDASTAANDLQKYINSLDVKENKYTADSYKEFEKALKQAQKVLDKQAGELDAITNAKSELYANLVKRGDIQSFKDELDTINKLKEKDYTSETWTILQDQVKLAQEFIKKDEATITEKEVINMVDALQKAKAQLVTKVLVSKEVKRLYCIK